MDSKTAQLIEQLAQKLGTTTEYLWSILIRQAADDMEVFIGSSDDVLGMFKFAPACFSDSGMVDFGEPEGYEIGGSETVFVLFPHGLAVPEDEEIEDDGEVHPQLN